MVVTIGDVTLAPGLVVSDGAVLAAGGNPTALKNVLGQSRHATGKAHVSGGASASPCVRAARARQAHQPDRIVAALDRQCAVYRASSALEAAGAGTSSTTSANAYGHSSYDAPADVAAEPPPAYPEPPKDEDNTKLYIAGGIVAALAILVVVKKLRKKKQ